MSRLHDRDDRSDLWKSRDGGLIHTADDFWPARGDGLIRAGRGMVLIALILGVGSTAVGMAFKDAPNDNPFFPSGPVFLASAGIVLAVLIGFVGLVLAVCGWLARS